MAGLRETKILKPIDKATFWVVSEFAGRNTSERRGSLEKHKFQRPRIFDWFRRQHEIRNLTEAVFSLWRGGNDGRQTRTRYNCWVGFQGKQAGEGHGLSSLQASPSEVSETSLKAVLVAGAPGLRSKETASTAAPEGSLRPGLVTAVRYQRLQ